VQPSRTHRPPYRFGTQMTWLGKRVLVFYGIIYVLELLLEHWMKISVVHYLQLYPLRSENFHVWQVVSHPLIHNPGAPIGFLINCLVFYFLTFLAKANPHGAYHLGGMLAGYVYYRGPKELFKPDRLYASYLAWRYRRQKSRFTIIDGGKNKDDDKPTYH